jgi:RNA polymerase sigma-70 factor (ECF subfamily)
MFPRAAGPDAIEDLFAAHFDSIYRFAACRVGRDAALDVASETFVQALRSADHLDPQRDARAWLFGVATNVLRHHHRAEQRRIRAYAAFGHLYAEPEADGHDAECASLYRVRLVEALANLDARDREALLLFAWADLSYEEIATALEIPVGTVRSRIHRARRVLRGRLTGRPPNSEQHIAVVTGEEA